ncbi:MAG: aminomethyl-transferring glycine dehydrogenase subunit GcvPA [Clostridium sp.]|nr:aminomethyl-transferring glycine dehydrogenase subunit GcvPA [Prevotella sp.]MCM1429185.1 aminomethyl-transferring glycine dehydrogenase subunit GcvPA [Clostridium sp.]MCM1475841.1 aminomethyl-transferring glycine dehydrogenase subunit GcvPA [Muribaculaceae bacterium]
MSNKFMPHTEEDIQKMLQKIGVASIDDLYSDVPSEVIFSREYDIPSAMSEIELRKHFQELGKKNRQLTIFAGGGAYDHYCPSAVAHLLQRSEFYTAYTPYQPEISQGTLQYIFEYQSMISELTGMESTNASMYDGATATAESMFMMVGSARKKNRVLLSATLPERVINVVKTYADFHGVDVTLVAEKEGVTDRADITAELSKGDVAGVIVAQPNKYGVIEDFSGLADEIHASKGFLTINADPSTLAVLRTPAEWGADIACGDGQTLGMPLQFGGPYLGYISCEKGMLRKMPGRVVGATTDADGKRAFVLTLQAREQHIRRQKATSNICSNQSLMALYATIYVALMGPEGLREVNKLSCDGAHYLYGKLVESGKFTPAFDKPFLKEFTLKTTLDIDKLNDKLLSHDIMGPLKAGDGLVTFAVTERRTKEEIDKLVALITED